MKRAHTSVESIFLALSLLAPLPTALSTPPLAAAGREAPACQDEGGPDAPATCAQIGSDSFKAGHYGQAAESFAKAVQLASKVGDRPMLAASLLNLGNAKAALGLWQEAEMFYQESARLASANRLPGAAAMAYTLGAKALIARGEKERASLSLRSAWEHLQAIGETREKTSLALGTGHLLQQNAFTPKTGASDFELAYRSLSEGTRLAESLGTDDLRAFGYGYLGALYLSQGRLGEALELTGRAGFVAQSINRPDILFRWQWQSGRILARQEQAQAAIVAYRQAIATLRPIRGEWIAAQVGSEPQASLADLYLELAELLLPEQTRSEAELREARAAIEQGKVAELEDYFRDDCVAVWLEKSMGIDRVGERTAVLYPILLNNRLELLLSLPDGLKRRTVHQDRESVRKTVESFRETLENRATPEYLPHAQALYDWLIRPLEYDLAERHIDTLVFVPDTVFRTIPLAALHDRTDFLVRHYAVATSPGLDLTDPRPIQQEEGRALVLGLSEGTQGFPPLPSVREEVLSVSGLFPSTVLENQSFQVDSIQRQLKKTPYRIVHIASHGQFGHTVGDTFLLAADGKISLDRLGEMMGVSRYRDEPVELLTLSACQTAAGDGRAALGLAGVAVKAGARSALASLWSVNDPASAELVGEFYRQIKLPGSSKAKSLQKAQWMLLDEERHDHPGYWAPFLLIGNWL